MKTYDAIFIFLTSLKDEEIAKALSRIRAELEKLGGAVVEEEDMGRRSFARQMQKQEHGAYHRLTFKLDPAKGEALRLRWKLVDEIFRVQVVNAVPRPVRPAVQPAEAAPEGA